MRTAALLVLLATVPPGSSRADERLSFSYDDTRLWAEITLTGRAEARSFILDTGATTGAGGGHTRVGSTGPVRLEIVGGGQARSVELRLQSPL